MNIELIMVTLFGTATCMLFIFSLFTMFSRDVSREDSKISGGIFIGILMAGIFCTWGSNLKWRQWALQNNYAYYDQTTGNIVYEKFLVPLQQAEEQRIKEGSDNSTLEQTVLDCE